MKFFILSSMLLAGVLTTPAFANNLKGLKISGCNKEFCYRLSSEQAKQGFKTPYLAFDSVLKIEILDLKGKKVLRSFTSADAYLNIKSQNLIAKKTSDRKKEFAVDLKNGVITTYNI